MHASIERIEFRLLSTSAQCTSCAWTWKWVNVCYAGIYLTHDSHIKEARWVLFFVMMYVTTSMFSPPWSPLTWDGIPYSLTADLKRLSTVVEWLLSLACSAVIYSTPNIGNEWSNGILRLTVQQKPLIIPWITIPQWISLWCPSMCQTAFGCFM